MIGWIARILCCTAAGYGCGVGADIWTGRLLQQRGHEYLLSSKAKRLLPLITTAAGAALGLFAERGTDALCGLLLLVICATVFLCDWMHRIIPNPTVLALFGLKLAIGIPGLLKVPGFPPFDPVGALIGMVACFIVFCLPGFLGKNVGAGDIKLAAAMGFLLGIYSALLAVVLMGLLVLAYTAAQNQAPFLAFLKTNIPMGPFIAVGMFAAYLGNFVTL